jgi:RNA polymerase sigma factor (sigma-70 family)
VAVDPIRGAGDPEQRVVGAQTAELFERHNRMVYGLCRALLRDPDDADDATQATFVSAYTALLRGAVVREPAAWIATIARNECAARAQRRMREPLPLIDADLGHTLGPESALEQRAAVAELRDAIAALPEKQREAVVLRDLYGLRYREVGAALGMSVASVESLLFRARRTLRVSLKPVATGALTVPAAVREGIAQALPGFPADGAVAGGAASGAAGVGLVAKLFGGPAAAKLAAGAVAVALTGSAAVVGVEKGRRHPPMDRAAVRAAASIAALPEAPPARLRAAGPPAGTSSGAPVLSLVASATRRSAVRAHPFVLRRTGRASLHEPEQTSDEAGGGGDTETSDRASRESSPSTPPVDPHSSSDSSGSPGKTSGLEDLLDSSPSDSGLQAQSQAPDRTGDRSKHSTSDDRSSDATGEASSPEPHDGVEEADTPDPQASPPA